MTKFPRLTLKFEGKAFDDGFNLFYLSKGLSNFNALLDKSFLTIEGKEKISEKDRDYYQVRTYDIRPGSFETDILIQLSNAAGSLIPLVTSMSPSDIWDLVTKSFSYLNTVLAANRNGETYSLQADNGSNINLINGEGATIIQIHPDVLRCANKSFSNFEELTKMINPEKSIKSIKVHEKDNKLQQLYIGVEEKVNFENKKRLDPEPIIFQGMIIRVDGEGFDGKLRVFDGNDSIPSGDYKFEFFVKDNPEKLRESLMNRKKITALRETVLNVGTLEQKIINLKIIEVK